jgi:ribonuclease HI
MIYYTDGFTIGGNPGKVGGGYTIVDERNNLIEHVTIEKPGVTNNETELLGVLAALKLCSHGDKIITDSENTRAWIKSGKPKARPDLKPLCAEAKELAERKQVTIEWQSRAQNLAGIYNEQRATVETSGAAVEVEEMLSLTQKLREAIGAASSDRLRKATGYLDRLEAEIRNAGKA